MQGLRLTGWEGTFTGQTRGLMLLKWPSLMAAIDVRSSPLTWLIQGPL